MGDPTPGILELTCPGCQASFRLTAKRGRLPRGPIPCPKCKTAIPVPTATASAARTQAHTAETPQGGVPAVSAPREGAPKAQIMGSGVLKRRRTARAEGEGEGEGDEPTREIPRDALRDADISSTPGIGQAEPPAPQERRSLGMFDAFLDEGVGVSSTFLGFQRRVEPEARLATQPAEDAPASESSDAVLIETIETARPDPQNQRVTQPVAPVLAAPKLAQELSPHQRATQPFQASELPLPRPMFAEDQPDESLPGFNRIPHIPTSDFSREETFVDDGRVMDAMRLQSRASLEAPESAHLRRTQELERAEDDSLHQRKTPLGVDRLEFTPEEAPAQAPPEQRWDSDEVEPGPFDLRDIVEAERNTMRSDISSEITRNPALEDSFFPSGVVEAAKPPPDDFAPPERGRVSAGDIFSESGDVPSLGEHASSMAASTEAGVTPDTADKPAQEAAPPAGLSSLLKKKMGGARVAPKLPGQPAGERNPEDSGSASLDALLDPQAHTASSRGMTRAIPEGKTDPAIDTLFDEEFLQQASDAIDEAELPTNQTYAGPANLNLPLATASPARAEAQSATPHASASLDDALDAPPEGALRETMLGAPSGRALLATLKRSLVQRQEASSPAIAINAPEPEPSQTPEPAPEPEPAASPVKDTHPSLFSAHDEADASMSGEHSQLPTLGGLAEVGRDLDQPKIIRSRRRRAGESQSGVFARPLAEGLGQESSVTLGGATERRGSGHIRLPTTEILEVLGNGHFRLMVEDIVYEPVDERGLADLIKQGVLMGAEMIAEADGDWMPINEHPVFRKLRKKMAMEAHAVLAKYRRRSVDELTRPPWEAVSARAEESAPAEPMTPAVSAPSSDEKPATLPEPKATSQEDVLDDLSGLFELPEEEEQQPARVSAPAATTRPLTPLPSDVAEATAPPVEAPPSDALPTLDAPAPLAAAPHEQPSSAPSPASNLDDATAAREPVMAESIAVEEEADPLDPLAPSRRDNPSAGKIAIVVLILAALIVAGLLASGVIPLEQRNPLAGDGSPPAPAQLAPREGDALNAPQPPSQAASPALIAEAMGAAMTRVDAARQDPHQEERQQSVALELREQGAHGAAGAIFRHLWRERPQDQEAALRAARALVDGERYREAREIMAAAMMHPNPSSELGALYAQSITRDPGLRPSAPEPVSALGPRQGRWAEERGVWRLELSRDGVTTHLFKPAQRGDYTWRAEIASWRLCEVMACPFIIPRTSAATLDRATLASLGEASVAPSEVIWSGDAASEVLAGALQEVPAQASPMPLEYRNSWRALIDLTERGDTLDAPMSKVLSPLMRPAPEPMREVMARHQDDLTTREFARQLSWMMTVDYLTNNRDRFTPDKERFGQRTQLVDGALMSTLHGNAWPGRASGTVRGRFGWVSRFSAQLLGALQLMTPEAVDGALFPDATREERVALRIFWQQREDVLKRVDSLVGKYNTESVLAFE